MIRSLLIANRGEIARRIIRTARRLSVRTIAVHSDVDAGLPFVREADAAVCIGPAAARESYLRQDRILAAAAETGAEAIHPGYGFLSENAEFAEAVEAAGLVWVGAPPAAIRAMGLKDAAKQRMQAAGVPVTPGYMGDDQSPERLRAEADAIGYPVLIKAVAGGGGKGMRRVDAAGDFAELLGSCRREAASSFGDDRVLIEKYILSPRHIEVQVFGDTQGNVVHLFERDCSLQRRHQKVIEEAPAPGMDEATRAAICDAAVRAARAVDYVGAGTIEFIADASEGLRADRIWFMEMNTRLQVEHPVTEAITGQDLVEWQLRVASGAPMPRRQEELSIDGWAMEARLYAENPATGFLPSIGRLEHLIIPDPSWRDVRIDLGVDSGDEVTPFYDPMIAKVIVAGPTRDAAREGLADVCGGIEVWPVRTNAGFLKRALEHEAFAAGAVTTGFIGQYEEALLDTSSIRRTLVENAAIALVGEEVSESNGPYGTVAETLRFRRPGGVWRQSIGFRLNANEDVRTAFAIDEGVDVHDLPRGWRDRFVSAETVHDGIVVFAEGEALHVRTRAGPAGAGGAAGDGAILAPMPGRIIAVAVTEGEAVTRGQKLVVMEAMKMEQALVAPFDGVVAALSATEGAQASEGAVLARIEKGEE